MKQNSQYLKSTIFFVCSFSSCPVMHFSSQALQEKQEYRFLLSFSSSVLFIDTFFVETDSDFIFNWDSRFSRLIKETWEISFKTVGTSEITSRMVDLVYKSHKLDIFNDSLHCYRRTEPTVAVNKAGHCFIFWQISDYAQDYQ